MENSWDTSPSITSALNRATVYGTEYNTGDYVVVGVCSTFSWPIFGQIESIESSENHCRFTCRVVESVFNAHYHAYEVQFLTERTALIDHNALLYSLPATMVVSRNGLVFLCIRHLVLE